MIQGYRRFFLDEFGTKRQEVLVVPAIKPLTQENKDELIQYEKQTIEIADYRLIGGYGQSWYDQVMQASCEEDSNKYLPPERKLELCEYHLKTHPASTRCGVYIHRSIYPHSSVRDKRFSVMAHCTGWGAFAEYDGGWRVQFCKIESLHVEGHIPDNELKKISDGLTHRFKVPLQFPDSGPCCDWQHTKVLFRNGRGQDVTLCRLNAAELYRQIEVTQWMGKVDFAMRRIVELENALRHVSSQRTPASY